MKTSRFQWEYRASASRRHKQVGEILRSSPFFMNYDSYQEWPVQRVNAQYASGREKFDWVVPTLKLVIEVHGEQHERPVTFGDMTPEQAQEAFSLQKIRDRAKENAAVDAGWTYIAFWPKDIITADTITEQYKASFNPNKPVSVNRVSAWTNEWNEAKKTKAKEWRKSQYQKQKEWKKNNV